jgi:hypothetical protein
MYPVDVNYKVEFLQTAPPPVRVEGIEIKINFSLTLPEVIFVAFAERAMKSAVIAKNDLIYLGTSEKMQNDFKTCVNEKFKNNHFSPEELKLDTIVSSIWVKSKTFIMQQLILSNNQERKAHEEYWQMRAVAYSLVANLQGPSGKFFTAMQMGLLVKTMEEVAKSGTGAKT